MGVQPTYTVKYFFYSDLNLTLRITQKYLFICILNTSSTANKFIKCVNELYQITSRFSGKYWQYFYLWHIRMRSNPIPFSLPGASVSFGDTQTGLELCKLSDVNIVKCMLWEIFPENCFIFFFLLLCC